ncbi:hypothetical protein ACIGW8_22210 [Streptomyces sioyaensis]|uniref:hypothetical protein n=1 Tax=Streptomyces sioyaensis TaxID=67364 RepID=UPI0037D50647
MNTTDEQIPAEVLAAAAGAVTVTHDHGMTHHVWRDRNGIGVLFDETPAGLARGGWAAWSPKCRNKGGVVGWYATKEEAADAVDEAWPTPAAEATEPAEAEHVISTLGGEVHEQHRGLTEHGPWPQCRTGAQSSSGTTYTTTSAPLSCQNCITNAARRRAYEARQGN